jgi:hypothetical protein
MYPIIARKIPLTKMAPGWAPKIRATNEKSRKHLDTTNGADRVAELAYHA